jgi:hypothetical protein
LDNPFDSKIITLQHYGEDYEKFQDLNFIKISYSFCCNVAEISFGYLKKHCLKFFKRIFLPVKLRAFAKSVMLFLKDEHIL